MKVSYPLSVKVSLWLLLNLLLLAGAVVFFFVARGGLGWDALLAGPTADLAIVRGNAIVAEIAVHPPDARAAALARASAAHQAELLLVQLENDSIIGPQLTLPPEVKRRVELARTIGPRREPGPGRGPPSEKGFGAPGRPNFEHAGEPPESPRGPPDPTREREGTRFVVRGGSPVSYWVGTRTGIPNRDRRPTPAVLIARVDSLWRLLRYLQLEAWILGGAGLLGVSIVFWLPLVRSITRSLGELTKATEQIADGRFDTRVPAGRRDEIGQLGDSVNRMAARLDAHVTGQKRFLADVAHELCSPLARLQLASGILAERAPPELGEMVADVRDEVQQMSTLVNELLAFTKAGLRPREVTLAEVELAPLIGKIIEREDGAQRIVSRVPAELRVRGDAALLDRALGNLVRNALRYAGATAEVDVRALRDGDRTVISVEDNGPGVPPDALDRLGEPFFRPDLPRTRELGGVGLGLSIVRSSITACGGDVRFANRVPHGFRAEVRLVPA